MNETLKQTHRIIVKPIQILKNHNASLEKLQPTMPGMISARREAPFRTT